MYLERLSRAGMESSKYYTTKEFNHGLGGEDDMPNCVQYAVCRAYESCEVDKPFVMFKGRSAGGYPDAGNFYKDTILPKGVTPIPGSIACFNNHVMYIERVNADGTCLITDSRYDSDKSLKDERFWRKLDGVRLKVGQKPNVSGIGSYQGCIYLSVQDKRTQRNANEQISVNEDMLNVRKKPNGGWYMHGCYCPMGVYNVLDKRTDNDNNEWYKLDTSNWVRSGEWLTYYPADESEIESLRKDNEKLKKENESLKKIIQDVHEMTGVDL